MSEENSVTWLCQRCGRRQDIELETDPVLLRVCDSCKIENWTRPVKGAVVAPVEEEPVSEPIKVVLGKTETSEPIAELEVTIEAELEVVEEIEEVNEKEAEIAKLRAQIAELEKSQYQQIRRGTLRGLLRQQGTINTVNTT